MRRVQFEIISFTMFVLLRMIDLHFFVGITFPWIMIVLIFHKDRYDLLEKLTFILESGSNQMLSSKTVFTSSSRRSCYLRNDKDQKYSCITFL